MSKKAKANSLLLLTAFIWGSAFVGQSLGMDHLGPFAFNGLRFILASIVLLPVIHFLSKRKSQREEIVEYRRKDCIIGGIVCGTVLFSASALQQFGLLHTSVGNAGFITALYIVIVPVVSIFLKKKVGLKIWIAVFISLVGLYLLCIPIGKGLTSINQGDALMLICAFCFAAHILVIDHFSVRADAVKLSSVQFLACAILDFIMMFIFEDTSMADVLISWKAILYTGLLSGGVGYTLQIVAQKDTDPVIASLILSLESVFAALCGYLFLDEVKTVQELIGCLVMFSAIVLAQFPSKKERHLKA